ncbi:MAG: hypothetical protein ACI80W_001402, partial [Porticoccaceae bacterium]
SITTECPLPDSPRNITPSTHLIVAFIRHLTVRAAKGSIEYR